MTYIFTKAMGWDYYRLYAVEYVQLYVQFMINFLIYTILTMLKARYQMTSLSLGRHICLVTKLERRSLAKQYPLSFLKKIKYDVCILKETVDVFNDIFGWPVLFIILYASLQVLLYMDTLFLKSSTRSLEAILCNISMILLFCVSFSKLHPNLFILELQVGATVNILLCDFIAHEAEKILALSYKLERHFVNGIVSEKEELYTFINVLVDNFPKFSAARFFRIERSTIFRIFEAVTTFVIIMIQFESNSNSFDVKACHHYCLSCNCTMF
jgi:gustatory receptor